MKIQNNPLNKRIQKTKFYNDLYEAFGKLNIKRFFKLDTSTSFVNHLIRKCDITELLKCIMNGRVTKVNNESNKHQESVAKIHSNVNEELG